MESTGFDCTHFMGEKTGHSLQSACSFSIMWTQFQTLFHSAFVTLWGFGSYNPLYGCGINSSFLYALRKLGQTPFFSNAEGLFIKPSLCLYKEHSSFSKNYEGVMTCVCHNSLLLLGYFKISVSSIIIAKKLLPKFCWAKTYCTKAYDYEKWQWHNF